MPATHPATSAARRGWLLPTSALLLGGALLVAEPARAAPLDALLDATGPAAPAGSAAGAPTIELELSGDLANSTVDVLGLRSNDPAYAGSKIGDYHGGHLRAALGLGRWQAQGSYWQRRLQDRSDTYQFNSWQLAGQVRLGATERLDQGPWDWALRGSAWGDQADQLVRHTSTRLAVDGLDTQVQDVLLVAPRDRQLQLDLIGGWRAGTHRLSGFVGAGRSSVSNTAVNGHSSVGNCPYDLSFGSSQLTATPTGSCSSGLVIRIPNQLLPYAAQAETNYHARYLHGGASYAWHSAPWGIKLGYELQQWQRPSIDPLIRQRGGVAYERNHILVGELTHELDTHVALLLRGQLMSNQFLGELPLAYNTISASRFGKKYGLVSAGLQASF
jgi:hypothetical protein